MSKSCWEKMALINLLGTSFHKPSVWKQTISVKYNKAKGNKIVTKEDPMEASQDRFLPHILCFNSSLKYPNNDKN